MSTLTMLLVAWGVLGDGSAPVPADAKECLCMGGEWEGTCTADGVVYQAHYNNRVLRLTIVGVTIPIQPYIFIDEGMGRVRVLAQKHVRAAIYKRDGPSVVICYRAGDKQRATSFRAGDDHVLLILRPVKPRK